MTFTQRFSKAFTICLPLFAISIGMSFWVKSHPSADLAVGVYIYLPIMVLSLPWTFLLGVIELFLRENFSQQFINYFSMVLIFISVSLNVSLLLQKYSFECMRKWLWVLAGVQSVLSLLIIVG